MVSMIKSIFEVIRIKIPFEGSSNVFNKQLDEASFKR